jgi:putative transposase
MTPAAKSLYAGYRFPGEVISHAVWLYFRFPLSLRMVEEMLAARGIDVSHETVRQWARKFGQSFANQIRRKLPDPGDKWHLDEVCLMISGTKHWLWRAVDQDGFVLDVLVQSRRDKRAAKRLLRKLLKKQCRAPRVMITDKLASYGAAKGEVMPSVEHRRQKGLLEFPVLVGLGRSERGAEALPGARLPCCRCCTRRLQISWNRDPRPASRRRWADGWARSCCPSRNRHGARSRNSSWAGCWPAVGTSRRRSWP